MYCAFHHVRYVEEDYPDLKCPVCSLTAELAEALTEVKAYQQSGDFKLDDDTAENARLRGLITGLETELAEARELLDTAMCQLQLEDDLDPFEPCPERDKIIEAIRARIDGKGE
jgi:C4-type Zn-finger protein